MQRKTSSCGILFLWIVIQHLLSSRCFWSQANTGCNPDFDFLSLGAAYRNNPLYCLQIPDVKSAVSFQGQRGHKSFAVFLGFSWFFSCWKASKFLGGSMSCGCLGAQGCTSCSVCRWESSLVRKEEWVHFNQWVKLKGQERLKAAKVWTPAATDHGSCCCGDCPRHPSGKWRKGVSGRSRCCSRMSSQRGLLVGWDNNI